MDYISNEFKLLFDGTAPVFTGGNMWDLTDLRNSALTFLENISRAASNVKNYATSLTSDVGESEMRVLSNFEHVTKKFLETLREGGRRELITYNTMASLTLEYDMMLEEAEHGQMYTGKCEDYKTYYDFELATNLSGVKWYLIWLTSEIWAEYLEEDLTFTNGSKIAEEFSEDIIQGLRGLRFNEQYQEDMGDNAKELRVSDVIGIMSELSELYSENVGNEQALVKAERVMEMLTEAGLQPTQRERLMLCKAHNVCNELTDASIIPVTYMDFYQSALDVGKIDDQETRTTVVNTTEDWKFRDDQGRKIENQERYERRIRSGTYTYKETFPTENLNRVALLTDYWCDDAHLGLTGKFKISGRDSKGRSVYSHVSSNLDKISELVLSDARDHDMIDTGEKLVERLRKLVEEGPAQKVVGTDVEIPERHYDLDNRVPHLRRPIELMEGLKIGKPRGYQMQDLVKEKFSAVTENGMLKMRVNKETGKLSVRGKIVMPRVDVEISGKIVFPFLEISVTATQEIISEAPDRNRELALSILNANSGREAALVGWYILERNPVITSESSACYTRNGNGVGEMRTHMSAITMSALVGCDVYVHRNRKELYLASPTRELKLTYANTPNDMPLYHVEEVAIPLDKVQLGCLEAGIGYIGHKDVCKAVSEM